MTRLLWECATVAEALDFLRSVQHAGGGSVVLGDRSGNVAAVEFPDGTASVEVAGTVARTNHFVSPHAPIAPPPGDANERNSVARLRYLQERFEAAGVPSGADDAADLMSAHGSDGSALCRHGENGEVRTVSSAIYLTGQRELVYAPDYPCRARWLRYSMAPY
jgi:isopenicillin-N N-acyltransferase-like protein